MHTLSRRKLLLVVLLLLACGASDARAQTALYGRTRSGQLITINTTTGAGTVLGSIPGTGGTGLANRLGKMYIWGGGLMPKIYEIDPVGLTLVSTISFTALAGGLNEGDFTFRSDGLGFVSDVATATQLHSLDISITAAPVGTALGQTSDAPGAVKTMDGMAFDAADTLFGISESSGNSSITFGPPEPTTRLYTINTTTAAITLVGDTGLSGTTCGGLAFDAAGTFYMAVGDTTNGSKLYTLNKTNGQATLIGNIGTYEVTGLAFGPAGAGGGAGVTVSKTSTTVAEGGATDTYTVVLDTAPTANVTITLNPGTQVTVAPTTLTFTPANFGAAQTVTVTAVDDSAAEGTHSGTIAHTAASSDTAYAGITIASVTANITDNDGGGGGATGTIYGITNNEDLITIDPATGKGTLVGKVPGVGWTFGLSFSNGKLYTYSWNNKKVHELNPATGAIVNTLDPIPGINPGGEGDIVLRNDGTGFLAGGSLDFYRIDLASSSPTVVGKLPFQVEGMTFNSAGVLFAFGTNSSDLYTINTATGATTLVATTGISGGGSTDNGALVFDAKDTLYAVSSTTSGGISTLYQVNPSTGATTTIGSTGFAEVVGLAISVPSGGPGPGPGKPSTPPPRIPPSEGAYWNTPGPKGSEGACFGEGSFLLATALPPPHLVGPFAAPQGQMLVFRTAPPRPTTPAVPEESRTAVLFALAVTLLLGGAGLAYRWS